MAVRFLYFREINLSEFMATASCLQVSTCYQGADPTDQTDCHAGIASMRRETGPLKSQGLGPTQFHSKAAQPRELAPFNHSNNSHPQRFKEM
jgi:hypothetical protein